MGVVASIEMAKSIFFEKLENTGWEDTFLVNELTLNATMPLSYHVSQITTPFFKLFAHSCAINSCVDL